MLSGPARTVARAKTLRRALSLPEGLLWRELRRRPDGLKFRRQQPAGGYVLDFYCDAARLCVEVDGMAHDLGGNPGRDAARDAWLGSHGVRVLRLPARYVVDDLDGAVRAIVDAARDHSSP